MAKAKSKFTVPGLSSAEGGKIVKILQERLACYNDLHLTLKHVHWNVVGTHFIGVHEMIDPQVDLVREFADQVAERIAALGGSPKGTPGSIIAIRTWEDYPLGRDTVENHLHELDKVYDGVVQSNRKAMEGLEELDLVTQDVLIGHTAELEKFQWFVRAHLESAAGTIPT